MPPLSTSWTPVRVVWNGKSAIGGATPAAGGRGLPGGGAGMFEDDGLTAVEFGPQRLEYGIAEVSARVAGHQDDAVGVQRAERIVNFGQGVVDVGERQRREAAEPVGSLGDQIGGAFVDAAGHLPPFIAGPAHDAGRADRQDPGRDLLGVHEVDGALGRPVGSYAADGSPPWLASACA
jgi:hypothetical protein